MLSIEVAVEKQSDYSGGDVRGQSEKMGREHESTVFYQEAKSSLLSIDNRKPEFAVLIVLDILKNILI